MPPLIFITHFLYTIYQAYNAISCNAHHKLNHQNAQWMHDLNLRPSSPRYLYTKKSLSLQESSVAHASLSWMPKAFSCSPRVLSPHLCHAPILVTRACLSCGPSSIVGDKVSLSCEAERLCCETMRCRTIVHTSLRTPSPIL